MKYQKMIIVLIALMLVFAVSSPAKTHKVRRVNVAPLIKVPKGGIANVDMLKELVDKHVDRIKAGFEAANAGNVFPAFIEQVNSGDVKEDVIPKGQHMEWMLFYSRKKVRVMEDAEWAGRKTLDVFTMTVQADCKDYHIIIPKACGNVTLVDSVYSVALCDMKVNPEKANIGDEITVDLSGSKCAQKMEVTVFHEGNQVDFKKLSADNPTWKTKFKAPGNYKLTAVVLNADGVLSKNECTAKVSINSFPPKCDLKVNRTKGYTGQPFKLDGSGSTDKDGEVVKADFTITEGSSEVDKKSVTKAPFIWNKKFKKSGIYQVSLKVTDNVGAVSPNTCQAMLEVQKRFYLLLEAGPGVAKGTYSGYAFARFGFGYLLVPERLSLIVSAGGALKFGGEAFKNHFLSNVLLNVHFGDFFLGGGLGYSSEVRNDWKADFDFVANIGYDIIKKFNKKGSIFGEIRVPSGTGLDFEEAHEFFLGFRYMF